MTCWALSLQGHPSCGDPSHSLAMLLYLPTSGRVQGEAGGHPHPECTLGGRHPPAVSCSLPRRALMPQRPCGPAPAAGPVVLEGPLPHPISPPEGSSSNEYLYGASPSSPSLHPLPQSAGQE